MPRSHCRRGPDSLSLTCVDVKCSLSLPQQNAQSGFPFCNVSPRVSGEGWYTSFLPYTRPAFKVQLLFTPNK